MSVGQAAQIAAPVLLNMLHAAPASANSCISTNISSRLPTAPSYASAFTTRQTSTIPFGSFKTHNPTDHKYSTELMETIKPDHLQPEKLYQRTGFTAVQAARKLFDWSTGYNEKHMTESKWIQRFLFLETVAGVPGMCAGMLRHLKSLRTMQRDHGWISTLLDEAENERMHLLTFFEIRKPGPLFRAMVILAQGVFFNAYFLAYLMSPRTCHAFVGYLEEEAVKTYTHALHDIDHGCLSHWQTTPAPELAVTYWKLQPNATMRDLILAVRADEAGHSHVNHTLSVIQQSDSIPFTKDSKSLP